MNTNTKIFLVAGLLIGLALAVFLSPFASGSPDGLEKVAEEEGFADTATDHQFGDSPLADYSVDGVDEGNVSTGASGLIGVLLTFGVGLAVFGVTRVLRNDDGTDTRAEQPTERTSTG